MRRFRAFDDEILELHPELKEFLKPSDHYPELMLIKKNRLSKLPIGSLNTRVVINNGEIVERVYKTPRGEIVSLSSTSKVLFDQAA